MSLSYRNFVNMKQHLPATLLLLILINITSIKGQSYAFEIGGIYAQNTRTEQDNYLQFLQTNMQLDKIPDVKPCLGLTLGFVARGNHAEFEAGGTISSSKDIAIDTGGNSLQFKAKDISLYFGGNYLPVNFIILGVGLNINAAENKSELSGQSAPYTLFESLPSTDFNIFRGYSVGFKAQAGFAIPFESGEISGIRILPFYAMSFGKYNFYDVTESRWLGYTGDHNTHFSSMGLTVEVALEFN